METSQPTVFKQKKGSMFKKQKTERENWAYMLGTKKSAVHNLTIAAFPLPEPNEQYTPRVP